MAVGACLLAFALAPASAAAVDRYVDAETGADSNTACPQANPCDTIAYALANSGTGDEILIDNGSYPEAVTVGDGRSLAFQNFVAADGTGPAIVDGGAGTGVTVAASGAGHVRGIHVRGDTTGVVLNGAAEVDSVVADDPDAMFAVGIDAKPGSDGSTIHDSTVTDPSPSATRGRIGIAVFAADVEVTGNEISAMNIGISASAMPGEVLVAQNEVTGTHGAPFAAAGIRADGSATGTVMVRGNLVEGPGVFPQDAVAGIRPSTNVDLRRNEVTGHQYGVFVGGDTDVTLAGDRLWGNTQVALELFAPAAPGSEVSATNVTVVGGISVTNSDLALDSSIVDTLYAAGATCTITHSRADAIGTDPSGCNSFQTTAAPQLVDPDDGDLHLAPGSPMIDLGNPADPGAGDIDFDGDDRAIDGTPVCSGGVDRRDIGADEFVPAAIDCDPPETTIVSGPGEGEVINEVIPAIGFSSEAGATFQCSENGAAFGLCSHEFFHNLGPLADGPNSFAVRAKDSAGNTDASPDSVSFVVDTAEPDTSLTKTPPKKTKSKMVKFKFEADEPGTFMCQLDQKPAFACDSPEAVGVKVGRHKFRVTATDVATNVEPEPAKYGFRRVRG